MAKMREYFCRGSLTLNGVTFFILAADQQEAEEKARNGQWHDWEAGGAESSDWELDARTVGPNE